MAEQDKRFLKVALDDAIIKATDENGDERLRLTIKAGGYEVLVRFPTYGNWSFYFADCARLMIMLGLTAGDIETDIDLIQEKHFPKWAQVVGMAISFKDPKELVDKIFFDYLRPEVPGLKILVDKLKEDGQEKTSEEMEDERQEKTKAWLERNMDSIHLFFMFQSILHIEDWYKKKSLSEVQKTFRNLIAPSLKDTSPKSITSPPPISQPGLPLEFG